MGSSLRKRLGESVLTFTVLVSLLFGVMSLRAPEPMVTLALFGYPTTVFACLIYLEMRRERTYPKWVERDATDL